MLKTNCPMCGIPTRGNPDDEDLVIDANIVCKDPVCQRDAVAYLELRERQTELAF